MVVHFVTQPQGQPVVQPFFTQVVEIDFSFFCSLRNVFFIQESDWEGNQSYSNFLEVCKLAGVLTTINKPTTGFFLCQIWTIIRPPGLLQPQLLILTQVSPFSLSQLYFSRYIAVSVKVNLRPFLWQLFLAKAVPCSDQIAFCSPHLTLTTQPVALTAIAKSECLIPASQEEPPTCNEILTKDHWFCQRYKSFAWFRNMKHLTKIYWNIRYLIFCI